MGLGYKNNINAAVTAVSNTFIDEYMGTASGEYVKVYLYLLRHAGESVEIPDIADALNHTEADVRRALAYWERAGVLAPEKEETVVSESAVTRENMTDTGYMAPESRRNYGDTDVEGRMPEETMADNGKQPQSSDRGMAKQQSGTPDIPDAGNSYDRMKRLSADEEFSALLYAVQQYLGKTFSAIECEKFAYFYDVLHMSCELLEYLAEYCAQNGHTSVRYLETVALNWHEKGIRTAEEAQEYSTAYTKDAFAVMKAFGLNSRKPAVPEQKIMEKWFKDYGFDRELVLEACSRTINAIHTPSFQYADSILTDWKKAGVKTLADVKGMDARRAERAQNGAVKRLQSYGNGAAAQNNRKTSQNQFHNFKQRDTDYDALMLQNVKEWMDSPE